MKKNIIIVILTIIIGGIIVYELTGNFLTLNQFNDNSQTSDRPKPDNTPSSNGSQVYNQAIGGVLTVVNYQQGGLNFNGSLEDFLREYFNGGQQDQETLVEAGIGSGFVIDNQNGYYYALTNNHVVKDSKKIKVLLSNPALDANGISTQGSNKKQNDQSNDITDGIDAEVVYTDATADISLIRFKTSEKLPMLKMGNSDNMQIGDNVYAIGTPYSKDLSGSMTRGIISGVTRDVTTENGTNSYLQTDATINPGNSGGPLLNEQGEVIGINTLKVAETGFENIGFSIPINTAVDNIKSGAKFDFSNNNQ
ncbi:MAG: S1C family serine protease [Mycoplasmatales bacterium]